MDLHLSNNNFENIIEYLAAFFVLLNCNSVYATHSNIARLFITFIWQLLLFIIICQKRGNMSKTNDGPIFLISFYILIYSFFLVVFNISFLNLHLIFSMIIAPILLIIYFYNDGIKVNNELFMKIENIIILLSIISIIFCLFEIIGLQPNMSISSQWEPASVQNIRGYFGVFFISPQSLGSAIPRNSGIFVEPAIYACVLNVGLFIELFIKNCKKINFYKCIILIITILLSRSTTGIIVMILAILYKLFLVAKYSQLKTFYRVIIILLSLLSYVLFKVLLINKRGDISNLDSSYNIRLNDIYASLKAWEQHPFVGNGFNNIQSIQKYMYSFRLLPGVNHAGATGLSTGFFTILAFGGILYLLFYLIPIILSVFECSYELIGVAFLNLILLIYNSISNVQLYIMILTYLISYSLIAYKYRSINKKSFKFEQ